MKSPSLECQSSIHKSSKSLVIDSHTAKDYRQAKCPVCRGYRQNIQF